MFDRGFMLLASGACFEVVLVAAAMRVQRLVVYLDDAGGDAVEQVAIVGDEDQCRRTSQEVILQPVDRVDVEVVGRLVEDEQVTVGGESESQRESLALSAR